MHDKSIFFRIPKTSKEGFMIEHDHLPYFYDRLHYHPEYQIKYIVQGTGDLFVGDRITDFKPGDLFLIGSNQSHVFKSDSKYFEDDEEMACQSVSIFFQQETLGEKFFSIEEMSAIGNLIKRSGRGIHFADSVSKKLAPRILQLLNITGMKRFLEVLSILNELANSTDYKYISSANTPYPITEKVNERVIKVINYILSHYQQDIKLEEVAKIANYSQAAFCHFFKERTRKTFIQYLTEVRVSQASKLLRNTDLNVSQICYESGFNNVSNFNRNFKKVMGVSPTKYRNKFSATLDVY